jgi:Tol biopolymer transport system component
VNLSPDGEHAAATRYNSGTTLSVVWLLDFSRDISTRFTFGSSASSAGVWSPEGSRIIFTSNRDGNYNLYEKPASGARDEELLLKSDEEKHPTSWSRDGRFLLYFSLDPKTKADLWILPLEGDKKPFPFLRTDFDERYGRFSPDGRWIAYVSDESGRNEIYVRSFSPDGTAPGVSGKWQISNDGGNLPRWRGDGRELYYLTSDRKLMAVEVTTNPVFRAGIPKALFQTTVGTTGSLSTWDVSADGKRFLMPAPSAASAQQPFAVVLNWQAALKK